MRRLRFSLLLLIAAAGGLPCSRAAFPSQSHSHAKTDPDRLGMTCAQILQMTSSDWVAKFTAASSVSQDTQVRAVRVYGECYDDRTNHLAAAVGRGGKGPLMGARGDFGDFENALKDFTAKALAASNPPADALKTAYARLYEKQFRYAFYQSYVDKSAKSSSHSFAGGNAATAETQTSTPGASQAAAAESHSSSAPDSKSANSTDPLARAKNRFGELIGALPEDKIHEVHAAFESVMVAHPIDTATELAVCRYAIFVLEPPPSSNSAAAKHGPPNPFSPPPF
jgi:hypothetical protein